MAALQWYVLYVLVAVDRHEAISDRDVKVTSVCVSADFHLQAHICISFKRGLHMYVLFSSLKRHDTNRHTHTQTNYMMMHMCTHSVIQVMVFKTVLCVSAISY